MDFLFDFGVTAILSVLKEAVKNKERKEKVKRQMLKIAAAILTVYGDDEEFQNDLDAKLGK